MYKPLLFVILIMSLASCSNLKPTTQPALTTLNGNVLDKFIDNTTKVLIVGNFDNNTALGSVSDWDNYTDVAMPGETLGDNISLSYYDNGTDTFFTLKKF